MTTPEKTPELKLDIEIYSPFGNLFREATVLIACLTAHGTILFGEKNGFYPEGIVRLVGGGIEKSDNNPLMAAKNELLEETGYSAKEEELQLRGRATIKAVDHDGTIYEHICHIYSITLPDNVELHPADDVNGITELNRADVKSLIENYNSIDPELWGNEGTLHYRWFDFGQVYGPIHQFTLDLLGDECL